MIFQRNCRWNWPRGPLFQSHGRSMIHWSRHSFRLAESFHGSTRRTSCGGSPGLGGWWKIEISLWVVLEKISSFQSPKLGKCRPPNPLQTGCHPCSHQLFQCIRKIGWFGWSSFFFSFGTEGSGIQRSQNGKWRVYPRYRWKLENPGAGFWPIHDTKAGKQT